MILFHGSLEVVATPKIMSRSFYRPLDFGTGFYTTSSKVQAQRWVENRLEYETGAMRGFINSYSFDEAGFEKSGLIRKDFSRNPVSVEWLRFVMLNRRGRNPEHHYDLVTGPVANDRVYTVISAYEAGFFDEAETIARMKTYRLANQFLFHTEESLRFLCFVKAEEVSR